MKKHLAIIAAMTLTSQPAFSFNPFGAVKDAAQQKVEAEVEKKVEEAKKEVMKSAIKSQAHSVGITGADGVIDTAVDHSDEIQAGAKALGVTPEALGVDGSTAAEAIGVTAPVEKKAGFFGRLFGQ